MRFLLLWILPLTAAAERINHEGRILGPLPQVTVPLLFNTPEADAVVSAMQIMPRDNAWNEDISQRPLLANSAAMIARVKSDLAATSGRQNLRLFSEMNFVLVPDSQPAVPITFFEYPDESDLDGGSDPTGLYPIPPNLPVEGWPAETGTLSNVDWQEDLAGTGGDRHSIIVKPGAGLIWETWQSRRLGTAWQAANGAKWNLASNALRPFGWTSADAGGLAMFPAVVRFDECQRGMVEHALRLIVKRTRSGPIYPATHQASAPPTADPDVPAMGQRFRLKASYMIPPSWSLQEQAVLFALKKYGAIVTDNGGFFSVSITPDDRYPPDCFSHIRNQIDISNFEVIQTTAADEGPRSPGAPTADAGADQWLALGSGGATLNLTGIVSSSAVIQWTLVSGPAAVSFGNPGSAVTSASINLPGSYTLMLSAADGVHPVAYDALVVTVTLQPTATPSGNDLELRFPTVTGLHYRVQKSNDLAIWSTLADNLAGIGTILTVTDPAALSDLAKRRFYRVAVF
ncbi:hypothetical protein HQ447_14005 [bacterium]|nr:hypothetical protein [bacterium]